MCVFSTIVYADHIRPVAAQTTALLIFMGYAVFILVAHCLYELKILFKL